MLRNFAKETLHTLGLILPDLSKSRKWYGNKMAERLRKNELLDPRAADQDTIEKGLTRELHHYRYWKKRLFILQTEFNNSDHASFPAYVIDRRKPKQWATLWATIGAFGFAVLAFILAIISVVYGGESVDEAKFANRMAFNASTSAEAAAESNGMSVSCCCYMTNLGSIGYYSSLFTKSLVQNSTLATVITITKFISTTTIMAITSEITSTITVTQS